MFELTPFVKHNAVYDPFKEFDEMEKRFFGGAASFRTDVKDTGDAYVIEAELPGFKKEDISVDFEKGYLTVSAKSENKPEEKEGKHRYVKQERRFACRRSYYIGEVDESKITAKYSDGVLQVNLPKKELPKPAAHKIAIE